MFQNKFYVYLVLLVSCVCAIAGASHAQLEFLADGYEDKYLNHDEGPGAEIFLPDGRRPGSSYIYEKPTIQALSHMYWALGSYKTDDKDALTEFMRINECVIYRKFFTDDLEWASVLDATKNFITENKSEFPTRMAFTIPLKLFKYREKRQAFEIQDDYKVSSRRFEFNAEGHFQKCTDDHRIHKGYPTALVIEFSRPFTLTYVPMSEDLAKKYIVLKNKALKRFSLGKQTESLKYGVREAYLVLSVKVFAHVKFLGLNSRRIPSIQLLGTLEGYEIYADFQKTQLLFRQNYVSDRRKNKLGTRLLKQYEILREKSKGEGVFY